MAGGGGVDGAIDGGGQAEWPELAYEEWRETRDTLHMYTQVLGKLRLALSPFEPEWANVPLYVTPRGLTTSSVPVGLRTIDAELDLIDHQLVIRSSAGGVEHVPLGSTVADFFEATMQALHRLDVDVRISVLPSEVPNPVRFPEDTASRVYDRDQAARFHRVLTMVDVVMKEHHARFRGRTTPVQFFWGTFDLALTRFSGRRADPPPGAGVIERFGGDAEEICAGWWPGSDRVPHPAFYAYAYPKPEGIEDAPVEPGGAAWSAGDGEFLLPYDAARSEPDPRGAILAFLESTYAAGAQRLGWSDELTDIAVPGTRDSRGGTTA